MSSIHHRKIIDEDKPLNPICALGMSMETPLIIGYIRHDEYRMLSLVYFDTNALPRLISHTAYAFDKRGCNLLARDLIFEHRIVAWSYVSIKTKTGGTSISQLHLLSAQKQLSVKILLQNYYNP
jgi:hypothetical protein